jgi:hypothetical protein
VGIEPRQCAFLVGSHQTAVTGDVAGKNRGKPSLDPLCGHSDVPTEVSASLERIDEANNVRFGSQAPLLARSALSLLRMRPAAPVSGCYADNANGRISPVARR